MAVERYRVNADLAKDVVCTKMREKKKRWEEGRKLERPEKGRDNREEELTEPKLIWGMLHVDDAGIVSRSRNSLAKMMTVLVAVCALFGLKVSAVKTETICLTTKGMGRVTFVTEAVEQVCKQTAKFVYLGATVCENADFTVEINRRVLLANLRLGCYGLSLYDQSAAPLRLKVRMLKAEENHAVRACHVEPHRGPSRHTAHGSPPIAPPLHRMEHQTSRRVVARMDNERLPKRVMFGEVQGGKRYSGGTRLDGLSRARPIVV